MPPPKFSYADYNELPSLKSLQDEFSPDGLWGHCQRFLKLLRDPTFDKWADQGFGVCLVHIDYTLEKDEIVMGRGDSFEPAYKGRDHYPIRWLPDGSAYEFTDSPWTASLPQELLTAFKALFRGMMPLLFGICYLPQQVRTGDRVAVVDAVPSKKQGIVLYVNKDEIPDMSKAVRTAWRIGSKAGSPGSDDSACYFCKVND